MLKIEKLIMLFVMLCSFMSFFSTKAEAAEEKKDIIKQIYLTDSNGNRPTDNKFNEKDTVRVNVIWSVPDNSTAEGDYFAFRLPDILAVNKDLDFDLKDQNGIAVARAHLDSQTKRVAVTFNDYVETHSNVKGTMYFNAKFDTDKIDGDGEHHLEFTEDDGNVFDDNIVVTDEEKPFDRPDEVLRKFGYFDKNDPNLMHWVIRVNVKGIDIHDAVLTDEIGEGHSLVRDSLNVSKLKYKVVDGKLEYEDKRDVTSEINIEVPNDNKFIIYFGDILEGHGYYINYDTRLVGDGNPSNSYTNKVSLIGNDEEVIENSETHKVDDGGGEAEGDTGSLEIIKRDSEDKEKLLQGAEFDLLDSNEKVVAHVVTGKSGKATVKDLKYGFYSLIETKAPEGYELEATPIAFRISELDETILVEVENTESGIVDPLGTLNIIKVDSEDKENLLSGAEFNILDSEKKIVAHVVTDVSGKATVKDLEYGFYQLVETKAPEGYELDATPKDFIIGEVRETISFEIENTKSEIVEPLGNLEVIKVDSEDKEKLLSGAEFDVLDSNKKVINYVVTDGSGKVTVKDLKYGNYQIVETKAPKGYELDKTPKDFTISEKEETISLEVENTKLKVVDPLGTVELIKVDSEDKEKLLSGAEFDIFDSNKKVVGHVTTDKNGKAIVKELKYDNYQLVETKAPEGYELDKTPIKFSINEKTSVAKLKITNVKKDFNKDNENSESRNEDNKDSKNESIEEELPKTNENSTLSKVLLSLGVVVISIQGVYFLKKFRM